MVPSKPQVLPQYQSVASWAVGLQEAGTRSSMLDQMPPPQIHTNAVSITDAVPRVHHSTPLSLFSPCLSDLRVLSRDLQQSESRTALAAGVFPTQELI